MVIVSRFFLAILLLSAGVGYGMSSTQEPQWRDSYQSFQKVFDTTEWEVEQAKELIATIWQISKYTGSSLYNLLSGAQRAITAPALEQQSVIIPETVTQKAKKAVSKRSKRRRRS